MADLKAVTAELLKYVKGDQDAFYNCNTNTEGKFEDPADQAEYNRVEALIERAEKALEESPE